MNTESVFWMGLEKTGAADGTENTKNRWIAGNRPASTDEFSGGLDFFNALFDMSSEPCTGPATAPSGVPSDGSEAMPGENQPGRQEGATFPEAVLNADATIRRVMAGEETAIFPGIPDPVKLGPVKSGPVKSDLDSAIENPASGPPGDGKHTGPDLHLHGSAPGETPGAEFMGAALPAHLKQSTGGSESTHSEANFIHGTDASGKEPETHFFVRNTDRDRQAGIDSTVENRAVFIRDGIDGDDRIPDFTPGAGSAEETPLFRLGRDLPPSPTGPSPLIGMETGEYAGETAEKYAEEYQGPVAHGAGEDHPIPDLAERPAFSAVRQPETIAGAQVPQAGAGSSSPSVQNESAGKWFETGKGLETETTIEKNPAGESSEPARTLTFKNDLPPSSTGPVPPTGRENGKFDRPEAESTGEGRPAPDNMAKSPVVSALSQPETVAGGEASKRQTASSSLSAQTEVAEKGLETGMTLEKDLSAESSEPAPTMILKSDLPPSPAGPSSLIGRSPLTGAETGKYAGQTTEKQDGPVADGAEEDPSDPDRPIPDKMAQRPVFSTNRQSETGAGGEASKRQAMSSFPSVRNEIAGKRFETGKGLETGNAADKSPAGEPSNPAQTLTVKNDFSSPPTGPPPLTEVEAGKFHLPEAGNTGVDLPGPDSPDNPDNPDNNDKRLAFSVTRQPDAPERAAASRMDAESPPRSVQNEITDQLVKKASMHLKEGRTSFRIDLKPESMGHIRLQISTEANRVALRITAELPMVKEIIENNIGHLKTELQVHGLKIDEFGVSVSEDSDQYRGRHQGHAFSRMENGSRAKGKSAGAPDDDIIKADRGRTKIDRDSAIDYFA